MGLRYGKEVRRSITWKTRGSSSQFKWGGGLWSQRRKKPRGGSKITKEGGHGSSLAPMKGGNPHPSRRTINSAEVKKDPGGGERAVERTRPKKNGDTQSLLDSKDHTCLNSETSGRGTTTSEGDSRGGQQVKEKRGKSFQGERKDLELLT